MTAVAAEGQQIEPGDVVFAIDGRPTVLLEGTQPAFRELGEGVDDGADVAQLEQNLAALGFDADGDLTVDEHFDAATAAAVEAWQESLAVEATGRVALGDVVFSSAPVTVAVAQAAVGDAVSPGAPILEVTDHTLLAAGSLPVELLDDVREGNPVEVTLGDGSTVTGTVRAVGGEATRPEEGDVTDSTVELAVQLDPTDSPAARQGADVALAITTATRDDVLTVPVAAIVDGGDGQPAVRVPEGDADQGSGRTTPVPFTPGLTANSYVEITEGPLTEGDEVLLPAPTPEA